MMNSYEKALWCINNRKDLWKPDQMIELFNKILDHPEWFDSEGCCKRKELFKKIGTHLQGRLLVWLETGNTIEDIHILNLKFPFYRLNKLYHQCKKDRDKDTLVIEVPKGVFMGPFKEGDMICSESKTYKFKV